MTGEELVKMWADESDAANDCIIEILESYLDFAELVQKHAEFSRDGLLQLFAQKTQERWKPILEQAKYAKKKAMEIENN